MLAVAEFNRTNCWSIWQSSPRPTEVIPGAIRYRQSRHKPARRSAASSL